MNTYSLTLAVLTLSATTAIAQEMMMDGDGMMMDHHGAMTK